MLIEKHGRKLCKFWNSQCFKTKWAHTSVQYRQYRRKYQRGCWGNLGKKEVYDENKFKDFNDCEAHVFLSFPTSGKYDGSSADAKPIGTYVVHIFWNQWLIKLSSTMKPRTRLDSTSNVSSFTNKCRSGAGLKFEWQFETVKPLVRHGF